MSNKTIELIAKYAIILAFFMVIELITRVYSVSKANDSDPSILINIVIPYGLYLVLNLIMAIIMDKDIKKLAIRADYAIALTIIARPIGICLFLIYLLGQQKEIQATT